MNRLKQILLSIGVLLITVPAALLMPLSMDGQPSAAADTSPVVPITAKRFEFEPKQITLKKGQPVIIRLTSADVTHGFFVRPLKIDAEVPAGNSVDIPVTPQTVGQFTTICHHFCGSGHGNMHMVINVVE